jgi:hypothetical protein
MRIGVIALFRKTAEAVSEKRSNSLRVSFAVMGCAGPSG